MGGICHYGADESGIKASTVDRGGGCPWKRSEGFGFSARIPAHFPLCTVKADCYIGVEKLQWRPFLHKLNSGEEVEIARGDIHLDPIFSISWRNLFLNKQWKACKCTRLDYLRHQM